ncbi:MAG: hypothetical protein JO023_05910 [Chloroflexi bacterium]|nr:hypothetical protein [Chloroflexota bacterium]
MTALLVPDELLDQEDADRAHALVERGDVEDGERVGERDVEQEGAAGEIVEAQRFAARRVRLAVLIIFDAVPALGREGAPAEAPGAERHHDREGDLGSRVEALAWAWPLWGRVALAWLAAEPCAPTAPRFDDGGG